MRPSASRPKETGINADLLKLGEGAEYNYWLFLWSRQAENSHASLFRPVRPSSVSKYPFWRASFSLPGCHSRKRGNVVGKSWLPKFHANKVTALTPSDSIESNRMS